jgi:sugar lactone lactonase YvrE
MRAIYQTLLLLTLLLSVGCADRSRRNPLDVRASRPIDLASPLEALAGDGMVRLRWDFTEFEDLITVRIWREGGEQLEPVVFARAPQDTSFVDTDVVNGTIYRYWLTLDIRNESELAIAGEQLATPGPEHGWIADAGSGLVWRLTPDGRRGLFARGRFPGLAGLAVDERTGAAWIGDTHMGALHRIDTDGTLHRFGTRMAAGGAVAVDAMARTGWAADTGVGAVYRFSLDSQGDTLLLEQVDANLTHPLIVAPSPKGGVWIADDADDRILWFDEQGIRGGQWEGLPGLVDLDASSTFCCQAWAIDTDGERVLRLTPRAPTRVIDFPFGPATAVDVTDETGVAWILGEGGVVAYDDQGGILVQMHDVPGTSSVFADEANGHLWIAGDTGLWKIALGGLTYRTQLTGFTRIIGVTVDPGI